MTQPDGPCHWLIPPNLPTPLRPTGPGCLHWPFTRWPVPQGLSWQAEPSASPGSKSTAPGNQTVEGSQMVGNGSIGLLDRDRPSLLPASGPLHLLFLLPGTNFPSVYLHCFLPHSFWSLPNCHFLKAALLNPSPQVATHSLGPCVSVGRSAVLWTKSSQV